MKDMHTLYGLFALQRWVVVNCGNQSQVRYVGRIWSLILIGHLHLSGIWPGLFSRMDIKKTCVIMRLDDVLNI